MNARSPTDSSPVDTRRLWSALIWHALIGADEAIDAISRDATATPVRSVPVKPIRSAPVTPMGAVQASVGARALAAAATDLTSLKEALERFDGLSLKATATNMVFGDGDPTARVMFVGEAPGAEEDRRGKAFVGASGQLLDKMLAAAGMDRENVYISNIVNWRPPGNRKPTLSEIAVSLPFIERHIELVDPAVLVLLGDTAAKALLARSEGITRLRGRWFDFGTPGLSRPIPTIPTFHPAYLLRSSIQKRDAWRDLLAIKAKLAELA
ncbi:MAG: uracil-DNA glycosylase [Pseudomonadota bacterium]|nr:uracil-DNA glycosylase [Pseudomonadota bacterium]